MKPILFDLPYPIETDRLILRPPCIGDGRMVNEAVHESIERLRVFMPWAANTNYALDDSEEFVRLAAANWILKKNEEPYLPLFIFEKTSGRFLGGTGFHHYDWQVRSIETGYWLRTSAENQGFMTEAVNALTRYAFAALAMQRLVITCDITNIRSRKIPERLGFMQEAILTSNRITPAGKISDTVIYACFNINHLPPLAVKW